MLKISEMAKLANTTRRTLIYYDEEGIFQPVKRSPNGYRYYDYDQLYELMRILGLKNLGIPLAEIKNLKTHPGQNTELIQLLKSRAQIDQQIRSLLRLQKVIDNNIRVQQSHRPVMKNELYQVTMKKKQFSTVFWVSSQASDCTEEDIASLFANFYQDLDSLAYMNIGQSGYLTKLTVTDPEAYIHARFRVIKEAISTVQKTYIPIITQDPGEYVSVQVDSDEESVIRGLKLICNYCQQHQVRVQDHLWQINSSNQLTRLGASQYMWLEYAIIE